MLTEIVTIAAFPEYVSCVRFAPDGTLLAAGSDHDGAVKLWDAGNGKEKARLRTLAPGVQDVRFFPSGKRLLASSREAIWLLDLRKGEAADYFEAPASAAAALPDERRFVSYGFGTPLRLWDVATPQPLVESKTLKGSGGPMDCTHDGRFCAVGVGTAVSLWDLQAFREVHFLRGHGKAVRGLAFAPDGRMLASGGADRKILLWGVPAGSLLGEIDTGKRQEVLSLAFLGGSQALASGTWDRSLAAGKLAVWDTNSAAPVAESGLHATPICIAASPDGRRIAAAYGHGGQVKIWDRGD